MATSLKHGSTTSREECILLSTVSMRDGVIVPLENGRGSFPQRTRAFLQEFRRPGQK
jgi:hypothetical protein